MYPFPVILNFYVADFSQTLITSVLSDQFNFTLYTIMVHCYECDQHLLESVYHAVL